MRAAKSLSFAPLPVYGTKVAAPLGSLSMHPGACGDSSLLKERRSGSRLALILWGLPPRCPGAPAAPCGRRARGERTVTVVGYTWGGRVLREASSAAQGTGPLSECPACPRLDVLPRYRAGPSQVGRGPLGRPPAACDIRCSACPLCRAHSDQDPRAAHGARHHHGTEPGPQGASSRGGPREAGAELGAAQGHPTLARLLGPLTPSQGHYFPDKGQPL